MVHSSKTTQTTQAVRAPIELRFWGFAQGTAVSMQRRPDFLDAPVSMLPIFIDSAAAASRNVVAKMLTDFMHSSHRQPKQCMGKSSRFGSSGRARVEALGRANDTPLNSPNNTWAKVADLGPLGALC